MPSKGTELNRWMQWLMTSHVRCYHKHYSSSGHVWQGRFKSLIVQKDDHLLTVIRYIERNPVRAGLVESVKDWSWSSYQGRSGSNSDLLLSELPIELPSNWQEYVDTPLTNKELEKIRQCVKRRSPFGDPDWQKQICMKFGLMTTLNPRGRPKKQEKK